MRIPTIELRAALKKIKPLIPKRAPKPILLNVVIEPVPGHIRATDLDHEVVLRLPVDGGPTAACVPFRALELFAAGAGGDEVLLSAGDGFAWKAESGGSSATLQGADPEEFPCRREARGIAISKATVGMNFTEDLGRAARFASRDGTRYALGGVNLRFHKGRVTFGATDGKILCQTSEPCDMAGYDIDFNFTVPTLACEMIRRAFKDAGAITVEAGAEGWAQFAAGDAVVHIRPLPDLFPKYENALPTKPPVGMWDVDRKALIKEMRRQKALLVEKDLGVVLFSPIGSRALRLKTLSAESAISAMISGPMDVTINLNPAYLITLLETVEEKTVTIEFTAPDRPILVREGAWKGMLMPLVKG